jgi:hypothetical protein
MHRSTHLIAALALGAAAGVAFAQGTPPTTASPNPATGAGQQSQTGTPMGTTGVLTQNNNSGSAAGTSSGTTMSQGSGTMNSGSGGTNMAQAEPMRPARADRN